MYFYSLTAFISVTFLSVINVLNLLSSYIRMSSCQQTLFQKNYFAFLHEVDTYKIHTYPTRNHWLHSETKADVMTMMITITFTAAAAAAAATTVTLHVT